MRKKSHSNGKAEDDSCAMRHVKGESESMTITCQIHPWAKGSCSTLVCLGRCFFHFTGAHTHWMHNVYLYIHTAYTESIEEEKGHRLPLICQRKNHPTWKWRKPHSLPNLFLCSNVNGYTNLLLKAVYSIIQAEEYADGYVTLTMTPQFIKHFLSDTCE